LWGILFLPIAFPSMNNFWIRDTMLEGLVI
jgi:hypothetical protein